MEVRNPRFQVRVVEPKDPDIELVEMLQRGFSKSDTIFLFGPDFVLDVLEIDTGRRWRIAPDGIRESQVVYLIGGSSPPPPRDRA